MDISFVKILISKVEYLGLDTETLRDLIKLSQAKELELDQFSQALSALDSILSTRLFESNSQPPQVSMLLKQLDKRIQARSELKPKVGNEAGQSDVLTSEILSSLMDIKSSLSKINNNPNQIGPSYNPVQASSGETSVDMATVFVNPIDESKMDSIKANVSIDSKVGDNIQSKLDRLKNLKKGI